MQIRVNKSNNKGNNSYDAKGSADKYILATDLDRTLLPNGLQEYDNTIPLLSRIIKDEGFSLIYVTGRNLKLVMKAVEKYRIPLADFVIGDVGTKVYRLTRKKIYTEDKEWVERIKILTPDWNIKEFKKSLEKIQGLELQEEEKQNEFKLSYYVNSSEHNRAVKKAGGEIKKICSSAAIVFSIDESSGTKLLDILPKDATKLEALEFLRLKLKKRKGETIYCGDSGNDILPLTYGYKSILVRNAIPSVKRKIRSELKKKGLEDNLVVARGLGKLNGYYSSGIIEGLIRHGILDESYSN